MKLETKAPAVVSFSSLSLAMNEVAPARLLFNRGMLSLPRQNFHGETTSFRAFCLLRCHAACAKIPHVSWAEVCETKFSAHQANHWKSGHPG